MHPFGEEHRFPEEWEVHLAYYETILDVKHLRIGNLDRNPVSWSDWAFGFKRSVRTVNSRVFDLIDTAERSTVEVDEENWHLNTEEIDVNQAPSELYDILLTVVNNGSEAMSVIRAVENF